MNHPAITRELIETSTDEELANAVWEYLQDALRCDRDDLKLRGLPRGLQFVWFFWGIDFEVPNGGFWQFFLNSSGAYALETLEALQVFGLDRRADCLKRALILHEQKTGRPQDCRERWDCDYLIDDDADRLDNEYCELMETEPVGGVFEYIRRNPGEFISGEAG